MYTKSAMPGKFEGNDSQLEAEVVYRASLDGCNELERGDVSEFGWFACVVAGRRYAWVVFEDNFGFVDITSFNSLDEAKAAFTTTFPIV